MDKETLITMLPKQRVEEVNKLLQEYDLQGVADHFGIPHSSFSKLMREGDYIYHKGDKKFYPFVRSESERIRGSNVTETYETSFIKDNLDDLQKLLTLFRLNQLLLLNERVYSSQATYDTKSIKMNSEIYEEFTTFCKEKYQHLKMQDLVAQALLDFMERYKR